MKYTVSVDLQAPDNDPVTMTWLREGSALDVAHTVTQLLQHAEAPRTTAFDPRTLRITITTIGD